MCICTFLCSDVFTILSTPNLIAWLSVSPTTYGKLSTSVHLLYKFIRINNEKLPKEPSRL